MFKKLFKTTLIFEYGGLRLSDDFESRRKEGYFLTESEFRNLIQCTVDGFYCLSSDNQTYIMSSNNIYVIDSNNYKVANLNYFMSKPQISSLQKN